MFEINGRTIAENKPPYIIAEISANHNGSIDNAYSIIDMAKRAGADAVKMQTYTPDTITLNSKNADFMITEGLWAGNSLYDLYAKAFTPWEWHADLFAHARSQDITIFSTPFDFSAIEFLEKLNAPAYKISSFECVDLPLIRVAASTGKPLIISTGMANDDEIQEAVNTALNYGSGDLTLLHCISGYPAPAADYNLRTLLDMKAQFGVNVGLSDHTLENTTAIAAVAMGAVIIEKHVTLDRNGGGPDDSFSLEEAGLADLCKSANTAWEALGKINYERTVSEKGNIKFRRSLYFVNSLTAGQVITDRDVQSIRPGYGIAPKYYDQVVGNRVSKSVDKHTPVTQDCLDFKLN